MAKHKVKRYDGEDGSDVSADPMEQANQSENLDTTSAPAAQRAPIVTKEALAKSGLSLRDYMNKQQGLTRRGGGSPAASSSTDDRSKRPSLTGTTAAAAPEARDSLGIPTSMGNAGKSYAPTGTAAESASGSELGRNLEAAGNATGASAAIQGIRRGAAVGKGLAEFAAGRNAAPAVAKAAAPAVNARRAAPNPATLDKFNEGLRKAKPAMDREAARQAILRADTLKTGGKVKGYASGGSISSASSRGDGIATKGKTRGKMC